jgi:polyphosphate kinase
VFLGSADMMPRNLDNRVELISPVEDPVAVEELAGMLEVMLADTALAWELAPDGEWARVAPAPGAEPLNSQDELMRRTAARGAHAE